MSPPTVETDVVVAGSGLSGLVASTRALEHGADVVLLEKGYQLGGTTIVTGGYLGYNPSAEPAMDAYEPIDRGIEWLEDHGVTVRDRVEWEHGDEDRAHARIDPPDFVQQMAAIIEDLGGDIRTETPLRRLRTGDDGRIAGAIAYDYEEGEFEIDAPSVILATGGYSANEEIVEQFFPNADVWLGRDPWSTGDGFIAAKEVGAKTTGELSNAVGVSRPAPPAEIAFEDLRCGQVYDTSSVAVDSSGQRFTDESKSDSQSDEFIRDFLKRVEGKAYLIIDQDIYENDDRYQSRVEDRIDLARELGGPVLEADTLEGLGALLTEEGIDGRQAVETVEEFNRAMRGESAGRLHPPREEFREPIDRPPFYAIGVIPGILYFVGGLDVTANAQVVSRSASTSSLRQYSSNPKQVVTEPIQGLYAAGVEVGQHSEDGCYGGLSLGLVTGRIAGRHAAEYAAEHPESV